MLSGKRIILGITGGIAAYKAAVLVSRLTKNHATVEVIMTAAAEQFITPLTFATLTQNPVQRDLFAPFTPKPQHIALAERGDLIVVAPATANTLAKLANGIADNLLSSVLLAAAMPILAAPAMNNRMWKNPATQENIDKLRQRGIHFSEPETGRLACGDNAVGRMAEPETILALIIQLLKK